MSAINDMIDDIIDWSISTHDTVCKLIQKIILRTSLIYDFIDFTWEVLQIEVCQSRIDDRDGRISVFKSWEIWRKIEVKLEIDSYENEQ